MSASVMAASDSQTKQTGPRTEAGKIRSSTNATLHGGTSRKLIIAGEAQADFDALQKGLRDQYQPDTQQSEIFVKNLAMAHWFLWRRQRAYTAIEAAVYENQPDEARWTEEHLRHLSLADRYRTQAERALTRALANVDTWQKNNRMEADREQRAAQWTAAHSVRERRMTLQEEKFELPKVRSAEQAFRFAKNAVSSPLGQEAQIEVVDLQPHPASDGSFEEPSKELDAA